MFINLYKKVLHKSNKSDQKRIHKEEPYKDKTFIITNKFIRHKVTEYLCKL